jgi:lipopolysaccharide/colanic/teichoic acid biosynthesis glycosyltransferase
MAEAAAAHAAGANVGRNRLSFDRLVQFDLAYIDNWSLWLDLKIFLKTIPHVASGRGAS